MTRLAFTLFVLYVSCLAALATETENLGISILPAPGKVVIDGKYDDWDLTGGLFTCSDVEHQRGTMGTWFHAMYDEKHLYLLVRWLDDTPMNNPGSTRGDYGFAGDCLQFRTITAVGTPNERAAHWTCWRDRDGLDVIDVAWGIHFDGGSLRDAKTKGAQQAFLKNADGKGYTQELAIPWELLCNNGYVPKAGDVMTITLEAQLHHRHQRPLVDEGHLQARRHSRPRLHLHGLPLLGPGHLPGKRQHHPAPRAPLRWA